MVKFLVRLNVVHTTCFSFSFFERSILFSRFIFYRWRIYDSFFLILGHATIFGKKIGCRPRDAPRFPFLGDAYSIVFFRFIYRCRILNSATIFDKKIGCCPHDVSCFSSLSVLHFLFLVSFIENFGLDYLDNFC